MAIPKYLIKNGLRVLLKELAQRRWNLALLTTPICHPLPDFIKNFPTNRFYTTGIIKFKSYNL